MKDAHATGQFGFNAEQQVIRIETKHPLLVGQEGAVLMTFQMLELAYLASRQLVLQTQGVAVQQIQGGPSAPTNGHAPVPRGGNLALHTEH